MYVVMPILRHWATRYVCFVMKKKASDGTLEAEERTLTVAHLPAAVTKALAASKYAKATVRSVERIQDLSVGGADLGGREHGLLDPQDTRAKRGEIVVQRARAGEPRRRRVQSRSTRDGHRHREALDRTTDRHRVAVSRHASRLWAVSLASPKL